MTSKPGFTNVSVQKFAVRVVTLRCWSGTGLNTGSLCLGSLVRRGLVFGFTAHQVWNQDENLTRMYIFEYGEPRSCESLPSRLKELESAIFGGIAMKLTAHRGVTVSNHGNVLEVISQPNVQRRPLTNKCSKIDVRW